MFKGLIFDWDGTLADTRNVLVASFKKALYSIDCEVSEQQIDRRIGIGVVETFKQLLYDKGVSYNDTLIQRLVTIKVQTEIELSKQVTLFTGARRLLDALDCKVKVALATMNQREFINHILKEKNLREYFTVTLTANEVNKHKPDPEIFLKTALRLDVRPENCVVIEDSIFGVKAAKAANMACIAVAQGAYSPAELSMATPDLIVNSLNETDVILSLIFR